MSFQMRVFVSRLSTNVNLYRLAVLGLAIAAAIVPLGMPSGGGGGVG